MGVYVDTVRAEHINALLYGQPIKVHALKYLFKPLYEGMFRSELVRWQKILLARAENYWARRGLPKYVTSVWKGFSAGSEVIEWKGDFGWYDCDKIPGKVVGKLIIVADNSRKGFHWEVEPTMLEINPT